MRAWRLGLSRGFAVAQFGFEAARVVLQRAQLVTGAKARPEARRQGVGQRAVDQSPQRRQLAATLSLGLAELPDQRLEITLERAGLAGPHVDIAEAVLDARLTLHSATALRLSGIKGGLFASHP